MRPTSRRLSSIAVPLLLAWGCKTSGAGGGAAVRAAAATPDEATMPAGTPGVSTVPPAGGIDPDLGEKLFDEEAASAQAIADGLSDSVKESYPPPVRARRDAHPKAHGCVLADFQMNDTVRPDLAYGMFQPGKSYKAWIRFSNGDPNPKKPDSSADARGMAIKVMGVPGKKILDEDPDATTQDFVMINNTVFFLNDPAGYNKVISRLNSGSFLAKLTIPVLLGIKGTLNAKSLAGSFIANPLLTRFNSIVPYRLGDDAHKQAIKFTAKPCFAGNNTAPKSSDPDYLRHAMSQWLDTKSACFEFLVQPRTSPSQSVEDATVAWSETEAPLVKVATITIPKQQFDTPEKQEFCDNLSFNPWHSLPEHAPLGGINRVRRVVYEQISKLRHQMNQAPRLEPTAPTAN